MIKLRAEIKGIENRETMRKKISETESWFLNHQNVQTFFLTKKKGIFKLLK